MLVAACLLWSSKCSGTFRATVLGVDTCVILQRDDSALVSVSGIGFAAKGVARLDGDNFCFDESFETFLRSRHIRILGIVDRSHDLIAIRVGIPLFGRITVRLPREANL